MLRWTRQRLAILRRLVPAVGGAVLVVQGASAIRRGDAAYENYWGGQVFPPVAVVLGLGLLGFAIFRPAALAKQPRDKHGRRVRFPHEDVRKW